MKYEEWIMESVAESDKRINKLYEERRRTNRNMLFALPFLAVWVVVMAMIFFS